MAVTVTSPAEVYEQPGKPDFALRAATAVGFHAKGRGIGARDRQARHPLREGRLPGR